MTVNEWHKPHNVSLKWLVVWIFVIHITNGLLQNCTEQYRPNLMCDVITTKAPCPRLEKVPEEWPPPPPIEFTMGTYMDEQTQINKKNETTRFLLPGLMLTWEVPRNRGTKSIKGFEASIIVTGGKYVNRQWCVRLNLTGPIDDLQTKFNARVFPVAFLSPMKAMLYSLPKPEPSLDEDNYVVQYVETPSFVSADHPVSNRWRFGVNLMNDTCRKEVTCSFTKPPEEFKFSKFHVMLVKNGSQNYFAKKTVVLPSHHAVFEGVPPDIYYLTIDVVDEFKNDRDKCVCKNENGQCSYCTRTASHKFSMVDSGQCLMPNSTTVPDTSTPDLDTLGSTLMGHIGEVSKNPEDGTWKRTLGPLVGVLIGIVLLLAVLYILLKKRDRIKCWGKSQAYISSDKPKPSTGSTNNNTVVEADPVLKERVIYLVYTDDNSYHQKAVKLLAKYLNKYCNCIVRYPAWCLQDIQAQGPIPWVLDSIQKADYVLILNSEGAFKLNQIRKENNSQLKLNDSPMGDIFTPAIKKIINNVYKENAVKKYIMVQFHYTEEKFQIDEISAGNKYTLLKHFGELLCHIHELNPEKPGINSQLLPLRSEDHDRTQEGSELQQAINMAANFTQNHPHWFEVMYGSEEETYDSGLSSLPLDSFPDHLREQIQRDCKENLRRFRPNNADINLPTELQLTFMPPMTDNDNISITQSQVTYDPPSDLYSVFTDIGLCNSPNFITNELGGHPVHAAPPVNHLHPYFQPQLSTAYTDSGRSSERSTGSQPHNMTPGLFNLTQNAINSIPSSECDSISMVMSQQTQPNECTSQWEEELRRDCRIPVVLLDNVSVGAMSV